MTVVRVGIIGVVGALLAVQFKKEHGEYGIYIIIGVTILIASFLVDYLGEAVAQIRKTTAILSEYDSFAQLLFRMIGISYMGELSADICKDAGYETIATQIELYAKLLILVLSLPILTALLKTIQGFLS